jgi:hypothetical protein
VKRVAKLIETSRGVVRRGADDRALKKGVKRYATERCPWSLFVEVRNLESKRLGAGGADGMRHAP